MTQVALKLSAQKPRKVIGGTAQTNSLELDISDVAIDDIRAMVAQITVQETRQQEALGNDPQRVVIDRREWRPGAPLPVDRKLVKTETFFGAILPAAIMRSTEQVLTEVLNRMTTRRTGRLANIKQSWEWRHYGQGNSYKVVNAVSDLGFFGPGDALVLIPKKGVLDYAHLVNQAVKKGSAIKVQRRKRGRPPRREFLQIGFMGMVARTMRRSALLRKGRFRFTAGFENEVVSYKQGRPYFLIRTAQRVR